ncbi:MAG TPA: Fur family transcriptional regulator [Thermoanaerobaculia bacterium]
MLHQRERQQFLDFLAARGARVTRERMALFDEIFTHHGHIDAEELLERTRRTGAKISRATVYRNLDLLVDCGLVHKHRLGRNRYLYEHVHRGQRHDHLVCTGCGRVVEFVSPGIEALQAEICRAHGFDPGTHTLQISSVCRACGERAAAAATEEVEEEAVHAH